MEIQEEFRKWLRKMGYNGEIPNGLISVCNNSTYFIWEQLLQNVKPKQEVEHIRRNIVLNRLQQKSLDRQDDFLYKSNEIDCFRRKQKLEQQAKVIKEAINEKQNKLAIVSQHYKLQSASINFLKQKISENEQREFILLLKEKDLNRRLQQAEELSVNITVTPVEVEQTVDSQHVKELLETCAKKLKKNVTEEFNKSIQYQKSFVQSTQSYSKKKMPNISSLETYIDRQGKDHFEQLRFSTKKHTCQEDENIAVIGKHHRSINVELFKTPKIIIKKGGDQTLTHCPTNSSPAITAVEKRESLGILHESYLTEVDDELLQNSHAPSVEDVFLPLSTFKDEVSRDSSITHHNTQPAFKQYELKRILYSDTFVNDNLLKLQNSCNKEILYTILQKVMDETKIELTKMLLGNRSLDARKKTISEDDITKLFYIHVQTEIKIIKQKNVIKDLLRKSTGSKFMLLNAIKSKPNLHEIQEWLDMNIQQVGLEASLVALRKEIESVNIMTDSNDLQIISMKISKTKDELANKIVEINFFIEEMYKLEKLICTSLEQAMNSIWDLRLYKNDMFWVKPLSDALWSTEVKLSESFPLEYQRRCTYSDPKTFYRDLCIDNYASDIEVSMEVFQMITAIIDSPFNPPETVLLSVIKSKIKLEKLNSLRKMKKWKNQCLLQANSLEEVERQESYVNYALEKLQSIIYSKSACDTLSTGDVIKKYIDIWTEMPMKNFISPKRLLNGQSYHFYEKKLKTFCIS
ncbi:uncharacterized protein LOC132698661 [Cylas formicarius]|uniref:uncharacterized protein LOC132698661 n=1 Tax=Cylas formicarius TaxID=197179 RepID=UPI002958D082|nr:uncharacterized protein LOC132698661 [Cylas formicarius]